MYLGLWKFTFKTQLCSKPSVWAWPTNFESNSTNSTGVIIRAITLSERTDCKAQQMLCSSENEGSEHQNGRRWAWHHAQETCWIINSSHLLMKATYNTIFFINCYGCTETSQDFVFILLKGWSEFHSIHSSWKHQVSFNFTFKLI